MIRFSLSDAAAGTLLLTLVMGTMVSAVLPTMGHIHVALEETLYLAELSRFDGVLLDAGGRIDQPPALHGPALQRRGVETELAYLDGVHRRKLVIADDGRAIVVTVAERAHRFSRLALEQLVLHSDPVPYLQLSIRRRDSGDKRAATPAEASVLVVPLGGMPPLN